MNAKIFDNRSSSLCDPSLIGLGPNLVVAAFRLMKILPAKYIIERGIARGEIHRDVPIVESSSGTFALGIGIVCAEKGIPFHIVSDAAIDDRLEELLRHLGGEVQIVGSGLGTDNNIQVMRLEALQELMRDNPRAFWTRQYDNLDNQRAYREFAEQLLNALGTDIVVVATVGSGGSSCGTIKTLREIDPSIKLVGVDTFGSVLFGLPVGKRKLRGLGNSIHPGNLDHSCFDEVHWVSAGDAFAWTRRLHSEFGLFCGPTSGAAYQVARWLHAPGKTVVFLAPDEGYRYMDTVFNRQWLVANEFDRVVPTEAPTRVTHPSQASGPWAYIEWDRRTLTEVTGQPHLVVPVMEQLGRRPSW
ncbi:cysteine synthase family protein [Nannocystis pusilla]|uniref:cysteine synthase family protein n=1 Tax=Nannocystis pusilla TaxID=889268 RepID=UPI003BF0FBC1